MLVVKDLQNLSSDALSSFESLARGLRATSSICVCGVTVPVPPKSRDAFVAVMNRLQRDGLVGRVNLRPLSLTQLGAFAARELEATLEPEALASLWHLTRGWPAVTSAVIDSYRRSGMFRTVDGRAYLRGSLSAAHLETSRLTTAVQRTGPEMWRVVKAAAVLSPLGDAAPRLMGRALGLSEPEVLRLLTRLEQAGVLKHRRGDRSWRFRLPLLATCVTELSGPYERRKLAQLAIAALWNGTAHCPDPNYLPDQLASAGVMVDQERARNELLSNAGRVILRDGSRAASWLRAAAELGRDGAGRARILLTHAKTCLAQGDAALALESSTTLLASREGTIAAEDLLEAVFVHLVALYRSGDIAAVEAVARGDRCPWQASAVEQAAARALALALLGRWQESICILGDVNRSEFTDTTRDQVDRLHACAELWLGSSSRFNQMMTTLPERVAADAPGLQEVNDHVGTLLVLAELGKADQVLSRTGSHPFQLGLASRSIAATYRGDIDEALELTQKCIATSAPAGCDPVQTAMYQVSAALQLYRGRLTRAQELIAAARRRGPALPHLLAITEAGHHLVLGEIGRARAVLENAVQEAGLRDVLARTEGLWILLADIALLTGQTGLLPVYLRRIEHVNDRMNTELTEINRLTLHALVESDHTSAQAAIKLIRHRRQPLEQVAVLQRLVRYGVADPALLTEAYSLLGEMNALLSRSSARTLMRRHNIVVPGRQEALLESERLLAVLVAESLSNKQIATVLASSEKSVESRLSRLFSKTGYQSRVELAASVLTGQFR
ncbi:LuxR C-terminal-related transcriptional regulator [Lentzea sp. JNUCC 0626]|uniref:helix-turn-helix transcriptional regulator n=1 Tax=Lentzea sp. JNUCC 0626 TaxID=3367513 RepID=UPI0037479F8B